MTEPEKRQNASQRSIVRTGTTVRRPMYPWSRSVHALLDHLRDVGFTAAPRVQALGDGDEFLSYLPGESGPAGWTKVVDERGLCAMARLLRDYHDAVAAWNPPAELVWHDGSTGTGGPEELICHGDFGPWNIVWDGVRPVGLLDWDYANPADPRADVSYALEYVAPFRSDEECLRWLRYPEPPDRRRRLELFAEAYGLTSTEGLADAVIQRQHEGWNAVRQLADRGLEPHTTWVAEGFLDAVAERINWSERHRALFT